MNLNDLVEFRLGSVDVRAREWLRKNTLRIAKQTLGSVFIEQAKSKEMSERYIDSVKFHLKGANTPTADLQLTMDVKSYKTDDGKPLWKWFEHGTKKHWIYPKFKKALRWETGGQTGSQTKTMTQILSRTGMGDPVYAFSKGHQVSGIKARKVLYWTTQFGTKKFQRMLIRELQRFLDSTATKVGV